MSSFKYIVTIILIGFFNAGIMAQDSLHAAPELTENNKNQVSNHDPWLAPDKGLHLIGSMIVTIGVAKSMQTFNDNSKPEALKMGVGCSISLGLWKEWRDSRKPNKFFSWKDLIADAAGIIVGGMIINLE